MEKIATQVRGAVEPKYKLLSHIYFTFRILLLEWNQSDSESWVVSQFLITAVSTHPMDDIHSSHIFWKLTNAQFNLLNIFKNPVHPVNASSPSSIAIAVLAVIYLAILLCSY